MRLSEQIGNTATPGIKASKQEKVAEEENWGPLIPVPESKLNSNHEANSKRHKLVSTYEILSPSKQNNKLPHHGMVEGDHSTASGSDPPAPINFGAASAYKKSLDIIRDFAHRTEALRRGDISAIPTTEVEENDETLPPVRTQRVMRCKKLQGSYCVRGCSLMLTVTIHNSFSAARIIHQRQLLPASLGLCSMPKARQWF